MKVSEQSNLGLYKLYAGDDILGRLGFLYPIIETFSQAHRSTRWKRTGAGKSKGENCDCSDTSLEGENWLQRGEWV